MAGREPQPFVEPPGVDAPRVGGELDGGEAAPPALLDPPADQLAAQPLTAPFAGHADRLDLAATGTPPGQAGEDRELHGGHDLPVQLTDHEELARVGVDLRERREIRREVTHILAAGAD